MTHQSSKFEQFNQNSNRRILELRFQLVKSYGSLNFDNLLSGSVQKNKQTNTKCWIGEKQTQNDVKENKPKNDTLSTLTFGASIMKGNIPRGGKRHC